MSNNTNPNNQNNPNNPYNNSIDCIFDLNGSHVVLIRRGHEPYQGFWALPGGRIGTDESVLDTLVREMHEEISVHITPKTPPNTPDSADGSVPATLYGRHGFLQDSAIEKIGTYSSAADPRGGNTTLYAVLLYGSVEELSSAFQNGDDASAIGIFHKDYLPKLAFDHSELLRKYFARKTLPETPAPYRGEDHA